MSEDLANKPLIEAIFELRWQLEESPQGLIDPHYQILIGRFFDRIRNSYPEYEQLIPPFIPENVAAGQIRHRFLKEGKKYPIVQIGSGVLTVNSTNDYKWEAFKPEICQIINIFFESHPQQTELILESISLRYINAVQVDLESVNICKFLSESLKINVDLEESLFNNDDRGEIPLNPTPVDLKLNIMFESYEPKGVMNFKLTQGQINQNSSLIWDCEINSRSEHVPNLPDSAESWLEQSHKVTSDWFFNLVSGRLLENFR